jgi:hypothetical protein
VAVRVGIDFHVASGIYQGVRTYLTILTEAMLRIKKDGLAYFIYAKNPKELSHWEANNSKVTLKNLLSAYGRFNLLIGRLRVTRIRSHGMWNPCDYL